MGLNVTEVQKALKGANYPASRDDLVAKARDNGAPDDVVAALERAGRDRFDGPDKVMEAVKGSLGGS
jgi:Protein of unknown function (DUF2795)